MTTALPLIVLIVAVVLVDFLLWRQRNRRVLRPLLACEGVRQSIRCPDCTGPLVQHAAWCGRGERPATERDQREVRTNVKKQTPVIDLSPALAKAIRELPEIPGEAP